MAKRRMGEGLKGLASEAGQQDAGTFVQYLVLGLDNAWRQLQEHERAKGRREFCEAVGSGNVTTYSYSLLGLKAGGDLLLWRMASSVEQLQENASRMLRRGLGVHLTVRYVLTGIERPSVYVRKPNLQDQGISQPDRKKYLVVYPFTKSADWYLLSREARQGIMNEHIRVGHEYPSIRQILAYSFGLGDQEFIVAYETDDLKIFQDLVMALRETESRRYALYDTPIFVGIHRPLEDALMLLG